METIEHFESKVVQPGAARVVAVEGAWFDLDRESWVTPDSRGSLGSGGETSALPDGCVSVDGARFDIGRGCFLAADSRGSRSSSSTVSDVPDGYVSVDGALLRVEPS